MRVFLVHAGLAGTDHETTVSEAAVVLVEFFFADEVDGGVVFIEVVRHGLDGVFDVCLVCTFFGNHVHETGVLLASGEFRHRTATDSFESCFDRAGVLLSVLHALDAADSVAMTLGNALAPERVVLAFREDRLGIHAVQAKHTRIPTNGDHGNLVCALGSGVNSCEVLRNLGVRVEGVDHVEHRSVLRGKHRQVCSRATANDEHVHLVLPCFHFRNIENRNASSLDLDRRRITTSENSDEFHIRSLLHGAFHTATEVTVTENSNLCHKIILVKNFCGKNIGK